MSRSGSVGAPPPHDAGETGAGSVPAPVLRRTFTAGAVVLAVLPFFVLLLSVPSNAVLDRREIPQANTVANAVPQGWGFFTRDPRDPAVSVFQPEGNSWERKSIRSYGNPGNLFGANREPRTEQYEIEALVRDSGKQRWHKCATGDTQSCLRRAKGAARTVRSESAVHRFCGRIALVRQEPVPWAWAESTSEMPAAVKFLDVSCEKIQREVR